MGARAARRALGVRDLGLATRRITLLHDSAAAALVVPLTRHPTRQRLHAGAVVAIPARIAQVLCQWPAQRRRTRLPQLPARATAASAVATRAALSAATAARPPAAAHTAATASAQPLSTDALAAAGLATLPLSDLSAALALPTASLTDARRAAAGRRHIHLLRRRLRLASRRHGLPCDHRSDKRTLPG